MVFALAISALVGCREDTATPSDGERIGVSASAVSGAGYTTFDAAQGGCNDSPNGVDCNGYSAKKAVFMSGGPAKGGGLADGAYFFAVLTPGAQSKAMSDGGVGNLSDTHVGGTAGDAGGGDVWQDRMFTVSGGKIVYNGPHAVGKSPNGKTIIQLWPFDDTDNPGGVYQLAICAVGATKASQCKYDAFRIEPWWSSAVCGDGKVQAGEQCDDGNTTNGDGCSSSCKTEAVDNGPCGCGGNGGGVGVDSTGSTTSSGSGSGTSTGSGGVGVDSTSSGSGGWGGGSSTSTSSGGVGVDSTSSGGSGGWGGGSSTSTTTSGGGVGVDEGAGGCGGGDVTPPVIDAVCGDGAVQGSEQCDDGNTVGGDGCSATCKTEICVALQRGGPTGAGVADAEIDEAAPNLNLGSVGTIDVGLGSFKRRQMLLAFDLSVIPAGADVIYAKVTVRQAPQVPDVITARVHRITAGWDEGTVTWSDFAGAYDPKIETSFLLSFGPKTFDVLGMAKAWASGTAPNFGMLIEADPATFSTFKSCEWWHVPDRPVLDLCYTVP